MKAPKQEEFSFKTKAERDKIEYLALEGGGGKGNVFFGAIQALEIIGKLPLTPENKNNNGKDCVIKGIAGASAGSITAYLLSLGCSSGQIKKEMTTYDFNDFFEKPIKGVYKCVTQEGGKNVFKLATDKLTHERKEILVDNSKNHILDSITGRRILIRRHALRVNHAGNTFNDLTEAIHSGKRNHGKLRRHFYHKNGVYSFLMGLLINNAIFSFFLGFIRSWTNSVFKKVILNEVIHYSKSDLLKEFRKIQDKQFEDRSLLEKIIAIPGGILQSKIFNYFVKLPIWRLYGLSIKESTNRSVISNTKLQLLGNEYLDDYLSCIKFDRAMYSGIEVRNFFANATIKYFIDNFNINILVGFNILESEKINTDINNNVELINDEINSLKKSNPLDYNSQLVKQQKLEELNKKLEELTNKIVPTIKSNFPWIHDDNVILLQDNQDNPKSSYSESIELKDLFNITFEKFNDLTNNDLRLTTTNISKNIPCVFSKENTPNFPIIDAVCMSMSIPFTFKSTFVNTNVKMGSTKDDIDDEDYHGFHVDGGMLNNFPLHLYDDKKKLNTESVNTSVLGIRLSDGFPVDKYKDTNEDNLKSGLNISYLNDPLYKKFLVGYYKWYDRKKNTDNKADNDSHNAKFLRTNRHTVNVGEEYYNGSFGMLAEYLQNTFDTGIYYYGEAGQMRNAQERSQALELFCYPIGLFDFAPTKKLVKEAFLFTQARSLIKSAAWLSIPFDGIEDLLKEYYKDEINEENKWVEIMNRLKFFYNNC